MRDYKFIFQAGQERELSVMGNCLHYVEGESDLEFSFDGSANSSKFKRGSGATIRFMSGFARVVIKSNVAQSVTVCVGDGESYVSGNTNIENLDVGIVTPDILNALEDVTIPPNSAIILAPALSSRRELRFTVAESAAFPIRFGPQNITATKGGLVYGGVSEYVNTGAAIYGFNTDPDNPVTVSLLSIEKS